MASGGPSTTTEAASGAASTETGASPESTGDVFDVA